MKGATSKRTSYYCKSLARSGIRARARVRAGVAHLAHTQTHDDVWRYIKANKLPYNPLHDQGFQSIGDVVTTEKTPPDSGERAGVSLPPSQSRREQAAYRCCELCENYVFDLGP